MLIGPKRIYRSPPLALVSLAEQKRSSAAAAAAAVAAEGLGPNAKEAKEKAAAQVRGAMCIITVTACAACGNCIGSHREEIREPTDQRARAHPLHHAG